MTVWFLISKPRTDIGVAEINAAHYWLKSSKHWPLKVLHPANIASTTFEPGDVIWCHAPCEDVSEDLHRPEILIALQTVVENGTGLLLSLTGAILPHLMGLEKRKPTLAEAGRWRKETGQYAYRGMAAYAEHPVFNTPHHFRTRLFTWTPQDGEPYWRTIYRGENPAHTIARGCRYLSFMDDEGCAWEYTLGKGRILCVGSYIFFNARRNYQRDFVEKFLENCITYVSENRDQIPGNLYWPSKSIGVKKVPLKKDFPTPPITLELKPEKYFERSGVPSLESNQGNRLFSVASRRILLTGYEGDRIAEIWSYPVRLLKNLQWTIRPDGKGDIPARGMPSVRTIFPDAIHQRYEYSSYGVREQIGANIFKPIAYQQLEIVAERPFNLVLNFSVDLALMWPMPPGSVGKLFYRFNKTEKLIQVRSEHKDLWVTIALSRTPDEVKFSDLSGNDSSELGIEILMPLREPSVQYLTLAFMGGDGNNHLPNSDKDLSANSVLDIDRSGDHYRNICKTLFTAQTPDEDIDEGMRWAQLKMEAFRAVTPGLGRGLTAGIADSGEDWLSTRPGYAWYFGRDSMWTSLGLLSVGQWNAVADSLRLLASQQAPDGKIFHELSPSNYAHHDSADANLLFIITAEKYLAWTGDNDTIEDIKPALRRALEFSFEVDRDGDCLTENSGVGHGWIEGGKLFGAHVTFYLAGLWLRTLKSAEILFKKDKDRNFRERIAIHAEKVEEIIRIRFWDKERSTYYYGVLNDGSMQRADTIMPAAVILFGDTEHSEDIQFLKRASGPDIITDWGARMISDLDERYNPTGYHIGSVWPLYTGWLGLAQYRRGRDLQGFELLSCGMASYKDFSAGCFSEVLRGDIYDEIGVCPQQAWSAALLIWLLTKGMLGLEAASDGMVTIAPIMPPHWTKARFDNLRWADGYVNIQYERVGATLTWRIEGLDPGERVTFAPRFQAGTLVGSVEINGEKIEPNLITAEGNPQLEMPMVGDSKPIDITILLDRFISPVPALSKPVIDQPSQGFRIIDWYLGTDSMWIEVMGLSGNNYEIRIVDPLDCLDPGAHENRIDGEEKIVSFKLPASKELYSKRTLRFTLSKGDAKKDG